MLRPKVYVNSVYNIDLMKLKKIKKIKGIIVDLDNTLVAWGEKEVSPRIIDWVKEAKKTETVVIGDQIFTDIWGGNRLKLLTILVTPIVKKDSIGTLLHRNLEKMLISFWLKKGTIKKEIGNWPK